MSNASDEARKRRRVRWVQRYLLNPPMKLRAWLGLSRVQVLLETTGRRSGRARRTVVGLHREGDKGWIVAEHGRHASYVRNLEAEPSVRVRLGRRWVAGRARVLDGDDVDARLADFPAGHRAAVRRFGTDLVTIEIDLAANATE